MIKVVIVNGMPETGKTTAQEICRDTLKLINWNCVIESSVHWVKEIAKYAGWDGTKTDKNRKFLSDLKAVLTNWDDAILKHLIDEVDNYYYTYRDFVIFIDIREPYEIERAKKAFNASTLMIRRPEVEDKKYSNSSDTAVFDYDYDYTIWNDMGIEHLTAECVSFLKKLLDNENNIYKKEESHL
jgi:hypothetical protein